MCHPRPIQKTIRLRGFTLIELLVVIAIILVLASILVPVLGFVRAQGDSTKCTANLRQLGTGISGYLADHDGHLPGPLQAMVFPAYGTNATTVPGSLTDLIAKYIGVADTTTTSGTKPPSVTTCPAFTRVVTDKDAGSYVLNFADLLVDLNNQVPWGDVAGGTQPVPTVTLTTWRDTRTSTIASVTGMMNLSQLWAIKDADQLSFRNMTKPASASALPEKPVHGEYRNALFYDWHVGRIDLDDKPL